MKNLMLHSIGLEKKQKSYITTKKPKAILSSKTSAGMVIISEINQSYKGIDRIVQAYVYTDRLKHRNRKLALTTNFGDGRPKEESLLTNVAGIN